MAEQDARNEFDAAVAAVKTTPADLDTWDRIEDLADELNCSDEVASLYKEVLAQDLPMEVILTLGERAANFFEEWFGDEPAALQDVLIRVLEVDPEAEWAFQRLTVVFSVTERWDEMFRFYDRAIDVTPDEVRRIQLLEEAAQVAKDVANQPDKAITYLLRLVPLKPGDTQLEHSLERLLERYERWADLIALWEGQLASQAPEDRESSRLRIAGCWLDNLGDPAKALEAVRPLLAEAEDDKPACGLLERIVTDAGAPAAVRSNALDLLRLHYESTERPREVVRVIEAAIEIGAPESSKDLREEAGARLAALEDDLAAMSHYAALLALDPSLTSIQEKMHELARRSSNFARYAEGVAEAADACAEVPRKVALLAEAARVRLDMLEDEGSAIRFYQAAMALQGLEPEEENRVARRLSELLARADRPKERLDVLERLAQTDPNPSSRRNVIAEAARLAESLGETERALELWKSRTDADEDDLFALDAMIGLLGKDGRWQQLIEILGLRVRKTLSEVQRRADLVRIATIHDKELDAPAQAIEAWLRVQNECGENTETVDALADLYGRTEHWSELVELLERASGTETDRVVQRLVRLADAYRQHLEQPERALAGYRSALAIDSGHEGALAGMTGLLEIERCRAAAADALSGIYRQSGAWARFVELLDPRLADAQDPRERLSILREAAEIQEREVGDTAAALASWARALPLAPRDQGLERNMLRLAEQTGSWQLAAEAYEQALAALAGEPGGAGDPADVHEAARLRQALAEILETRLDRGEDAHAAFMAVLGAQPGNLAAVGAAVRLGTRQGRWDEVAAAFIGHVRESNRIDTALLDEIEAVAAESGAFDKAASALTAALDAQGEGVSPRLAFTLHRRIAGWQQQHRDDAEAARDALRRALSFDGAPDAERAEALRALAAIERAQPGRELFDTLRRLSEVAPGDLDVLREVAEVAVEHLDSPDDARVALTALMGRASAAWRGTGAATGEQPAETYAGWALERLVDHHLAQGNAAAAVDLLGEGARLPFDDDTRRAMRLRAAGIASDQLKDNARATQMYQALLSQAPGDLEAMERLAELYEAEGRVAEKLSLRRHQITLEQDPERRIALRLEIAELVGKVEELGGRLDALLANLDDQPGHAPSLEALHTFLDNRSEHAQLADVLEKQATRLQDADQGAAAAGVWSRLARIAEEHTKQIDRAIQAYRRVVDLSSGEVSTRDALSALARLYMERKQPAQAVPWFENLLAGAAGEERQDIVLKLAQAHLQADQIDRAVACLEGNLSDEQPAMPLRTVLVQLYRDSQAWEPLARLLTKSLPLVPDNDTAIAYAREAADIYSGKLDAPGKAVPALKKALTIVSGDRTLRTQLAIGLRVADRLDESLELLNELIEEFGRRRSPDRAVLHVEVALVKKAQGHDDEALKQMELAAKMDVGNVRIQRQLAEMARQTGKLAQAERTYRALLLVVRRQPPGDDVDAVGASEVLFEMHKLAAEQGQEDQAKELLQSALEAAVQNDAEVRRLRRSLLAHGETETLLEVLRMRLEASEEGVGQADLLADIAEVLDKHLGRAAEALAAILEALEKDPTRVDLHERARVMARAAGKSKDYVDTVKAIADSLRRREDPPLVARQLMRAGEAQEQDVGDMEGALELYQRVEALGERTAEAYFAIARVCGHLGKTEEQARVLEAMLQLAHSDEPSPAQIDALYRLAEIFIESDERRAQGIDLLEKAFSAEPRYTQAGASLKVAATAEPDSDRITTLYERVARSANDWQMLLDFLERRAQRSDATPSQVREAVTVAVEHDQPQRAEALLGRAVEAARASDEGIGGAVWAVISLAETRMSTGDLDAARDLVHEVAEYAEADKLKALAIDLAERAAPTNKALAAEMYELLRERNPSDRQVWEPLLELYRTTGDSDRLQAVVLATLPTLVEPAERNALRMQQASYMIGQDRSADAVEILRDVLLDDPDHIDAGVMLEDVLRKSGDQEGLADFLWQRFEDTKERGNAETIPVVAARLGALLDQMGSNETLRVYREALEVAPESVDLVRAVLEHIGPEGDLRERAELTERLVSLETPERAVALALELCNVYQQLDDEYGVQRALERGHAASPGNDELRQRLEAWYREREMWLPLTELMVADAERLADAEAGAGDVAAAVVRLREAAAVHRDTIGDAGTAAGILRRALALEPGNAALVVELATCLGTAGDPMGATEAIGEALESGIAGEARIDLLLLRSELRVQVGEEAQAIADLEEAYGIDAERIRPQLIAALDQRRLAAEQSGDAEGEREALMGLIKLLADAGQGEAVRPLLMHWVERNPQDRESLYTVLEMDRAQENWEGMLEVCARLVNIEDGPGQVRAALGLAEAAERAGRPGDAVQALEVVHQLQPDSGEIRDQLRRVYELSGEHRQLAAVLLADGDHAQDDDVRYQSYRRAAEVLLHSLEDPAAAAVPAGKARELRPEEHDAMLLYADVLLASGQTDQVVEMLEAAIAAHKRRSPELGMLQQRMARVAAVLGDRDNELAWLKKAFDVDRKNGEIAAELAKVATEMGDYDLALKPLRAITLMENPGPVSRTMALLWEAKIEHARGNKAKAELWAKKALREDPDFADAQEFLDQISQ